MHKAEIVSCITFWQPLEARCSHLRLKNSSNVDANSHTALRVNFVSELKYECSTISKSWRPYLQYLVFHSNETPIYNLKLIYSCNFWCHEKRPSSQKSHLYTMTFIKSSLWSSSPIPMHGAALVAIKFCLWKKLIHNAETVGMWHSCTASKSRCETTVGRGQCLLYMKAHS